VPIYEYRCRNGHTFEVFQRMTDDPVAVCEVCAAPVERVFHPVAVHFKGSGFYTTDYARKGSPSPDGKRDTEGAKKDGKDKPDSKKPEKASSTSD
jgi:putative FmdB family regulatory protein